MAMRPRTWVIGIIVAIILLPIAGALIFIATFDPNRYAPDVIAAVEQATGRQLTLGGPIRLKLSMVPTIEVSDVSLANPPGFADPNLLTLDRAEAQISLLPLLSHRVNIVKLVLVAPRINLESNAAGEADWDLSPPGRNMAAANGTAGQPAAPGQAYPAQSYKVALESVEVQNGLLTMRPAKAGPSTLSITNLTGNADAPSAPLSLKIQAVYNSTPFTVSGTVGPVERLSGIGGGPWPVDLALQSAGASATVKGTIAEPRRGRGYDVTINASIPALEAVTPILPAALTAGMALPPLHGLTATARIVDQNSAIPAIDKLSVKAGASDLSSLRPGLMLTSLDIEMASLDKPLAVNAAGSINGAPLSLAGNFGAVQSLVNPALLPGSMPPQGSFPVSLQAQAGGAKLSMTGAIATPVKLAGVALSTNVTIPDLSALDPLAGTKLPAWKNIVAQASLIDPGGLGLRNAVGLDGLVLTMDNAAFGGDVSLYFGSQRSLRASISAQRIDLDALLAALPASPAAPPPAVTPTAAVPLPPAPTDTPVIPSAKLPLDLLKAGSADIQVAADSLVFNKAVYSAIQAHAVLTNGVLTVNPVTGQLPGGSVSASAALDASKDPAQASLTINAPALALSPFLKAIGLPDTASGTMQAQLNATGAGDSLHDMAASMNGQLGLASVNGIIDGGVIDSLFGTALRTVGLSADLAGAQGPVAVRCFALRVDANNGVGTIRALTLDSDRLRLQGGGTINFGPETLGIVLRPQLLLAGSPVGVPVQIGGTFRRPVDTVASLSTLKSAAAAATGLTGALLGETGSTSLLGNIAAAVGLGAGSAGDVCPDALSLGRLGQPGPAAPAAVGAPGSGAPATIGGPKSLLNSLFGK